jgi:fructose-1-phosphate kinase PfkB-like protein
VKVVSAVGSGDSLLAGIALGTAQSLLLEDSIRQGVAAGTANAMTLGAGVFTKNDFQHLLHRIIMSISRTEI